MRVLRTLLIAGIGYAAFKGYQKRRTSREGTS